ncbi:MAG: hypothetical protein H6718_21155 [Polyangiaceae bacterium]|nr:hypothetical protein [Polyangiaceae bacterium]
MTTREEWAERIQAFTGRPVRWAPADQLWGDYDGRNNTIEIFNVDGPEQRELYHRLRSLREDLESKLGALIVIFHTRKESQRLYSDFITRQWVAEAEAAKRITPQLASGPRLATDVEQTEFPPRREEAA